MKALSLIFAIALTVFATTSHAEFAVAPCGKIFNRQNALRDSNKGIFIPGRNRMANNNASQSDRVSTDQ